MSRPTTDMIAPYRIEDGKGFRLTRFDPADTAELAPKLKRKAKDLLAVVDALARLDLSFPPLDPAHRKELRHARAALEREAGRRR
jgi:hypothetical protein